LRMLPWPVAVGMLAHALRWVAMTELGAGVASGALVACVVVGCCSHQCRVVTTCRSPPSASRLGPKIPGVLLLDGDASCYRKSTDRLGLTPVTA
jgi:hypothetical protein